jgi:hypothetical protein
MVFTASSAKAPEPIITTRRTFKPCLRKLRSKNSRLIRYSVHTTKLENIHSPNHWREKCRPVLVKKTQQGLLLEGLLWREIYDFSEDCVVLVLASEHYDENDYIRDYESFLTLAKSV